MIAGGVAITNWHNATKTRATIAGKNPEESI
jgi:hypothetical protein